MKLSLVLFLLVVATVAQAKPVEDNVIHDSPHWWNNDVQQDQPEWDWKNPWWKNKHHGRMVMGDEPINKDQVQKSDYQQDQQQEAQDEDNDHRFDDDRDWNDWDDDAGWWEDEARDKLWDDNQEGSGSVNNNTDINQKGGFIIYDYDSTTQQPDDQLSVDIVQFDDDPSYQLNQLPSIDNWYYNDTTNNWYYKPEVTTPEDESIPFNKMPSVLNWHYCRKKKMWYYRDPFQSVADRFKDINVPLEELPSLRNWHHNETGKYWYFKEVPEYPHLTMPIDVLPSIVNWRYNETSKSWFYDEDNQQQPQYDYDNDEQQDFYISSPQEAFYVQMVLGEDPNEYTHAENPHSQPKEPHKALKADQGYYDVDLSTICYDQVKGWIHAVAPRVPIRDMVINRHPVMSEIHGSFIVIDVDDLKWAARDAVLNANNATWQQLNVVSPFSKIVMDVYLIDKSGYMVRVEFHHVDEPVVKTEAQVPEHVVPSKHDDTVVVAEPNSTIIKAAPLRTLTTTTSETHQPKPIKASVIPAADIVQHQKAQINHHKPVKASVTTAAADLLQRQKVDLSGVSNWHWNDADQEWKWAKN